MSAGILIEEDMENQKKIDQCFVKVNKKEFKGPATRKRFREELIRLVFDKIQSTVFDDFFDRERYVELLQLLMAGKSHSAFVLSTRETYFIDEVELMENRVRRSFEYPMWHFTYCKADHTCRCVYTPFPS